MKSLVILPGAPAREQLLERGYHAVYRPGEPNRCPGCSRSHWHVGRSTAECGFCSTALPIAAPALRGVE